MIKKLKSKSKFFTEKEIWKFAWELVQALNYLHNNNIIHRDIKTQNIFLTKENNIKVYLNLYIFFIKKN